MKIGRVSRLTFLFWNFYTKQTKTERLQSETLLVIRPSFKNINFQLKARGSYLLFFLNLLVLSHIEKFRIAHLVIRELLKIMR